MNTLSIYEQMLIHECISERVNFIKLECPCADCTFPESDCPIMVDMTYCARHRNWIQKLKTLEKLEWKADHTRIKYYVED